MLGLFLSEMQERLNFLVSGPVDARARMIYQEGQDILFHQPEQIQIAVGTDMVHGQLFGA